MHSLTMHSLVWQKCIHTVKPWIRSHS
jgi:hypothetical protein